MNFKIGSLFDGSGGFPLAATMCGGTPVWASEVEPYPIAVTKSRFPGMIHLGSVTEVKGNEVEPVDVITFGSPCQDLSVAGKRAGLKHEDNGDEETTRSGLFMEAVRIIKEMREATNGVHPRFAVWENVPGAFSSNKGEDFRTVCEELIKIVEPGAVMPAVPKNGWPYADSYCGEGWSLSYRTYDAQYWGVPQRRRRIYLVADFGGECAGKVSFEREGVRGYFAESGTPWQGTAADAQNCVGANDRESEMGERGDGRTDRGVAYTLKIRSGCEGGGKGALIQTDKSATLATNNDQYLFQPVVDRHILDDQGGSQIGVRTDGKAPTLRAEMHGNVPCVMDAAGFCTEHSAQSRGIGYEEEIAPTLRAGVVPGIVGVLASSAVNAEITDGEISPCLMARAGTGGNQLPLVAYSVENHPADSRVNLDESGKVQTLTSRMGTGGGNVPMVLETQPVYCLQGNGIDRADTASCNGKGVKEDICYTLNTIDRPAVAYGTDVGFFNSVENCSPTLLARQYKDPHLVTYPESDVHYIVRRLTPTECARLQGFADAWAVPDSKEELTDEEYRFWLTVRNTHAEINGRAVKEYTKAQMLTWYNKLHTDGSEYKLWGNGIAIPTALYVMQGISDVLKGEITNV